MKDETNKDKIREAAESLGAEAFFDGDNIPDNIRNAKAIFQFTVHEVVENGKSAVGFHVDWPEGEPSSWDNDPTKYTSAQVASIIMSQVLQDAVIALLQRSQEQSAPANSTNGKSFDDFMAELDNIDNPSTKH
jgi:hypothetical protein